MSRTAGALNRPEGTLRIEAVEAGDPTRGFRYYDLKRNWTRKIVPHLDDPELNEILVRDFNKFTVGTRSESFKLDNTPEQFDEGEWRNRRRLPWPLFWYFVADRACHWIVNFALRLAMLVEPERPWRILHSPFHSTVWDGGKTLFDFNLQAKGTRADVCFEHATKGGGIALPPGEYLSVPFCEHWITANSRKSAGKYPQYQEPAEFLEEDVESFQRRLYKVFRALYPADIKACRAIEITPELIITWNAMADDAEHPAWRDCPPLWPKIVDAVVGHHDCHRKGSTSDRKKARNCDRRWARKNNPPSKRKP
jgi:hypothetical protein